MMNEYNTKQFTNAPGAGLDASGNLLPGYRYMTYSNGVGQGTPQKIGDMGLLGNTVTANAPPAAGTYNPNITAGPQQQAAPSWANAPQQPQQFGQTMKQQVGWGQPQPFTQQQFSPYSLMNSGLLGNNSMQQNYGSVFQTQPFNNLQGSYSAYGGSQNPYGGQMTYRRGLLG